MRTPPIPAGVVGSTDANGSRAVGVGFADPAGKVVRRRAKLAAAASRTAPPTAAMVSRSNRVTDAPGRFVEASGGMTVVCVRNPTPGHSTPGSGSRGAG
jgi:hypothetical protein